jgi:hypothetical protein
MGQDTGQDTGQRDTPRRRGPHRTDTKRNQPTPAPQGDPVTLI